MNNKRNILLAVTVLVWASLACKALSPSETVDLPQETGSTEESNPLLPSDSSAPATEEAAAQSAGLYDGSWVGTNTVDDKEILFRVENNQVVSIALNYTGESNGCDYHGALSTGSETGGIDPIAIDSDSFSAVVTSVNDELTFSGTLTSETEASGTLLIKSSAEGICGEYEKEVSWTATKDSSAEAETTEDSSGTVPQGDPTEIVTQYFDAVNTGDINSAIALTDENIMFTIGTTVTKFSSSELESYLESTQGVTYQLSDATSMAAGTMVQFKVKASDGTTYSYCQAFVTDGKITMMSWMP
ncbi:MAG: hypothetical protein U0V18_07285 [Anaerolineales bacterium]